jgi:hypothetical protein
VTGTDILNGTILTADIGTDTILAGNIAAGAVGTSEILDNTIGAGDIASNAVTASELAADSVADSELMNGGSWNLSSPLVFLSSSGTIPQVSLKVASGHAVFQISSPDGSVAQLTLDPISGNPWALSARGSYDTTNSVGFYYGSTREMTVYSDGNVGANLSFLSNNFDLAEYILPANTNISQGDIVISNFNKDSVNKSTSAYSTDIIGIISTNPGLLMGHGGLEKSDETEKTHVKLALSGRVPTKVSSVNGYINKVEPITSSSIPGFGMKATKAGQVVGKALESTSHWNEQNCPLVSSIESIKWPDDDGTNPKKPCFRLPDGTYVGKIMAFINVSWYDPDAHLTNTDELKILGNDSGTYVIKSKDDSVIDRIGTFTEIVVAKIRAGVIEAKKIIIDGVDIGKKIVELEEKLTKEQKRNDIQQKEIDDLKKTVEELKTK